MAALKGEYRYYLEVAASKLIDRALEHHTFALADEDVMSLVQTPIASGYRVTYPFTVEWDIGDSIETLVFTRIRNKSLTNPDPDFKQKITEWAIRRRRLAYERGLAVKVIEELDRICVNPAQIRYLWPTVVLLCKQLSQLEKLLEKINDFKTPRSTPAITANARNAMREVSGFLTAYSMFENKSPEIPQWPGEVRIASNESRKFEAHGMVFVSN